jgi:hypothetical protein
MLPFQNSFVKIQLLDLCLAENKEVTDKESKLEAAIVIDYFFHRFNVADYRLAMTLLVKNEADIIEANIRTHASLGVDAFAVMDNGSTDGTREILTKLQLEFEIIVIDEIGFYNQSRMMQRLARIAKNKLKADWVINNDADEFWLPRNTLNLKQNLAFKGSVLTCSRYNMLLDEASNFRGNFFDARFYVATPIAYTKAAHITSDRLSTVFGKLGPKTIVNPHGLLSLRDGNHKALHLVSMFNYLKPGYDSIKRFDNIEVFHYPIRSYAQFEANVVKYIRLFEGNGKVIMGARHKRWIRLYNQGKLLNEFNSNLVISLAEIEVLIKFDIVRMDSNIQMKIIRN